MSNKYKIQYKLLKNIRLIYNIQKYYKVNQTKLSKISKDYYNMYI